MTEPDALTLESTCQDCGMRHEPGDKAACCPLSDAEFDALQQQADLRASEPWIDD